MQPSVYIITCLETALRRGILVFEFFLGCNFAAITITFLFLKKDGCKEKMGDLRDFYCVYYRDDEKNRS